MWVLSLVSQTNNPSFLLPNNFEQKIPRPYCEMPSLYFNPNTGSSFSGGYINSAPTNTVVGKGVKGLQIIFGVESS